MAALLAVAIVVVAYIAATFNPNDYKPQIIQLVKENFAYSKQPKKARDADRLIFTKENFQVFPDLRYADFIQAAQLIVTAIARKPPRRVARRQTETGASEQTNTD